MKYKLTFETDNYDDDNEYPLWFTDENIKAQQEALDNFNKQISGTPTIPVNELFDKEQLTRALDEGYEWAVKNHPDNFKKECNHEFEIMHSAIHSYKICKLCPETIKL